MAGIYIHIPFCRQACHYCNFHFSVSQRSKDAFIDCLVEELSLRKDFFGEQAPGNPKFKLQSIYLGGGTPSTLPPGDLSRIFTALKFYFDVDADAEITLEANPDDLTPGYLTGLSNSPVSRLSIGIQSFHKADLDYMNRVHSPMQALQCIEDALEHDFRNLTIDLIYGTPTMSDQAFRENLEKVVRFEIPHISAYALTVEPKTALDVLIRKGTAKPVDEEQCARQFELLTDFLTSHGYLHYEISNFALPGRFSRHNLSYWTGALYLGLGPSAHSFSGNQRSWNIANTSAYIDSIKNGILPLETEQLSPAQQYDEYLMTSFRTMWGCSIETVEKNWGKPKALELIRQSELFVKQGLMLDDDRHLILTPKGKLFADRIASDLFWV